jgi:hypothetical protein
MASVDNHELAELAADLRLAPGRVKRGAKGVAKKGALEVKRGMQKEFRGHRYAGKLPSALEFEQIDGDGLAYDIGELDSAGPSWGIAAIMAFGTSNNAPVVDHTKPIHREALVVQEKLADVGEDALLGGPR